MCSTGSDTDCPVIGERDKGGVFAHEQLLFIELTSVRVNRINTGCIQNGTLGGEGLQLLQGSFRVGANLHDTDEIELRTTIDAKKTY